MLKAVCRAIGSRMLSLSGGLPLRRLVFVASVATGGGACGSAGFNGAPGDSEGAHAFDGRDYAVASDGRRWAAKTSCFFAGNAMKPAATVEFGFDYALQFKDRGDELWVRLTLSPDFVDNTYGDEAIGWESSKRGTHTFKDLVGSDHARLIFSDRGDDDVLDIKLDYISPDPSSPDRKNPTYIALGVDKKGDGKVNVGDQGWVKGSTTSLAENLTTRGYGDYVESSPPTNAAYDASDEAPNWDYRVSYEVVIDSAAAFGDVGFGAVRLLEVHASPSKGVDNSLPVDEDPCPPDWCRGGMCDVVEDPPESDEPQGDPPNDEAPNEGPPSEAPTPSERPM